MLTLKIIENRFLLILSIFIIVSCASDTSDNQALKEEVISIHDEVMPQMGALKSHQKRLIEEANQLSEKDSILYQEEIRERRDLAQNLNKAYEGMFVWMRQFQPNIEDMEEEAAKVYLQDQKIKIEKVNSNIKIQLAKAKEMNKELMVQAENNGKP